MKTLSCVLYSVGYTKVSSLTLTTAAISKENRPTLHYNTNSICSAHNRENKSFSISRRYEQYVTNHS